MSNRRTLHETLSVIAILIIAYAAYGYGTFNVITHARMGAEEATYLIKSWRYVSSGIPPYSDQDPTWFMPLYFYQLGFWQAGLSQGLESGRFLSAIAGALSGIVLFDVVRRITGNRIAAALSTLILLTVPTVIFYFSTTTPTASLSLLLLITIWVMAGGTGKPRVWRSTAIGVLLATLYFYQQNMILAATALIAIYLLSLTRGRLTHIGLILIGGAIVAAPLLVYFPDRFAAYAMRLPLITPLLAELGLLEDPLSIIARNTITGLGVGFSFDRIAWQDIVDGFLLPYAGLIFSAGAVFVLARGPLKVLWVAPLTFLFLATTLYINSLSYCSTCILPYTASYAGIGGLCAGIAVALAWRSAKRELLPPNVMSGFFAVIVIGLNVAASGLATRAEYQFYPSAMLSSLRGASEKETIEVLVKFLETHTEPNSPVLVLNTLITVPYAAFLSDLKFPAQGINLSQNYRRLKPTLNEPERKITIAALEQEGLWTDENLERWLSATYDTVVFQADPRGLNSNLLERIERDFDRTASTGYRGQTISIYRRKLASLTEDTNPTPAPE